MGRSPSSPRLPDSGDWPRGLLAGPGVGLRRLGPAGHQGSGRGRRAGPGHSPGVDSRSRGDPRKESWRQTRVMDIQEEGVTLLLSDATKEIPLVLYLKREKK